MQNTFACIVSGRLVQTNFELVDANKLLITIPEADNINHLVVFMTGVTPLPDGMAGAVYFSFPDPNEAPTWYYLGYICNQKPSAIFKITKLKHLSTSGSIDSQHFGYRQSIVSHVAQIGVSIEPLASVVQLHSDPSVSGGDASEQRTKFEEFVNRTAENLFNYCASFANNLEYFAASGQAAQQFVPLATINEWYKRFTRNLDVNPSFWRN